MDNRMHMHIINNTPRQTHQELAWEEVQFQSLVLGHLQL
jgi:hypothetical protein